MNNKPCSEKTKRKISESNKGKHFGRRFFSIEHKRKLSNASKGNKNWLGKHHSEETRKKIRKALNGKKHTEERRKNQSEAALKRKIDMTREKNLQWQGGKSFEPYGLEFNNDLKEVIRNRDRRKCQMCEKTELENQNKLDVHHVDYNKQNNNPNNLISLCRGCHSKTTSKREYWLNYFYVKPVSV